MFEYNIVNTSNSNLEEGGGALTHDTAQLSPSALKKQKQRLKHKDAERWKYIENWVYFDGMKLTLDEMKFISYIVRMNQMWEDGDLKMWVDICANKLQDKFENYTEIRTRLVEAEYIELRCDYRVGLHAYSYRINKQWIDKPVVESKVDLKKKKRFLDTSEPTANEVEEWILACKRRLKVVNNPLLVTPKENSLTRKHCGLINLKKIDAGAINWKSAKTSGRYFDSHNTCVTEYRECLGIVSEDGKSIETKNCTVDISACFPSLLYKMYEEIPDSNAERERYKSALANDIRETLRVGWKLASEVKVELNKFISGKRTTNDTTKRFKTLFPLMYDYVMSQEKRNDSLNVRLTRLETRIMRARVATYCTKHKIFYADLHDGCNCYEKDAELIKAQIEMAFLEVIGIKCLVKITLK